MRGLLFFFAGLLAVSAELKSERDPESFENKVFDNRIKTVQLYKEGWNLSYPVIALNSEEKLVLHFDLLGDKLESYNYTFIHCDKDWNRSDIFTNEYLEGFPENPVEEFSYSFNTTVRYIHYMLAFPNDRVKMKCSGNYILSVCSSDNPDKQALTLRFIITENIAGIKIDTHRPQLNSEDNFRQQVDFTVNTGRINIKDPYRDIFSFILQNGRWNNAKRNLKPDVYGGNELKYNSLSEKNIFYGGNEFRYFDIRNIKYQSEFIRRIDFVHPYYNILLTPSDNREFKPYFYRKDFNGKFYVATREGANPETDADYVNVFFTLPSKYVLSGGNMHVSGDFNCWAFNENNLMIYNPQAGQYECAILLKQGWYDYEYVFLRDGDREGIASTFEGSHYETENDYLVLVYYRNPLERYDRLIGTASANTFNRISY